MSAPVLNTNDIVQRDGQKYQVVIADDNIFVICPIIYDDKESCDVVNYEKAEIYSNLKSINTLEDLKFSVLRKEDALNDEQRVIRALELCRNEEYGNCALRGCPLHSECRDDVHTLEKLSLDLINRKNAEISELQKRIVFWREDINYNPEKIKSEAVKEFVERFDSMLADFADYDTLHIYEIKDRLDHVKEMEGDRTL